MTATETRKALMRCNLPSEQIKLIEDYARLQIEKDRERVKERLNGTYYNQNGADVTDLVLGALDGEINLS